MLTDRQQMVLDAITQHWVEHGYAPSLRELCGELGLASLNGLRGHIDALCIKGRVVTGERGEARTIRPTSIRVVSVETLERWMAIAPENDAIGDEIAEVIGGGQ